MCCPAAAVHLCTYVHAHVCASTARWWLPPCCSRHLQGEKRTQAHIKTRLHEGTHTQPQPPRANPRALHPEPRSRSRGHACAASQLCWARWLRAGRPWPGRQREEEEGSAAQTARRQQTPANSSGHTMANTGGEPPERPRHAADCIRLQAARSRPGHGTARGRVPRTPPYLPPPSPPFFHIFSCSFPIPEMKAERIAAPAS